MRARWHWSIPAVAILALLAPLLVTDHTFSSDWGNHYWLIWEQGLDLRSLHEPSYYLQSSLGAFYPYYAFYGGSFYVAAGLVSGLTNTQIAIVAAYLGALLMAYLGWTWIARQAGVRGWRAQLPGCLAVTAPLAVTNLYGRGDVPEVVATAALPLLFAAAISFVREPTARLRSAAAFVVAVVVLTGTHTLTLVWGVVFALLVGGLLAACYWPLVRRAPGRLLGLAWLAVLGACVNAWILTPLILYHGRLIESAPDAIGSTAFTDPSTLFGVLRNAPDPYPVVEADINAQLPALAILWALACGAMLWRRLEPRARALMVGLLALGVGLTVLILSPSLIERLPETLRYIQFPYRILTYVDLCAIALVTVCLAGLERERRRGLRLIASTLLALIAAFNLVISVVENQQVRSWLNGRGEALVSSSQPPPSWYGELQFADGSAPLVRPTLSRPLAVSFESGIHESYLVAYPPGPAGTAETNIATGSYLVHLVGAVPVGRTEEGMMVVRLPASTHDRRVEVSAAWDGTVEAGRWISLAAIAIVLFGGAGWALRRRRT